MKTTKLPAEYELFLRALDEKLHKGAREHGDKSWDLQPAELLAELQAECLDLAGWGFILWTRLERAKASPKAPKLCAECGKQLEPGPINKQYCNERCRDVARRRAKAKSGFFG